MKKVLCDRDAELGFESEQVEELLQRYNVPLSDFKLQSQDLVTLENQKWVCTCDLYRQFLAQTLLPG